MDRKALEHGLARRLLHHIEHGTTDMGDEVLEVPAEKYCSAERFAEEVEVLFLDRPLLLGLSGLLPYPGSYRTFDICGTPILVTRDPEVLALARRRGVVCLTESANRGHTEAVAFANRLNRM